MVKKLVTDRISNIEQELLRREGQIVNANNKDRLKRLRSHVEQLKKLLRFNRELLKTIHG